MAEDESAKIVVDVAYRVHRMVSKTRSSRLGGFA